MSNALVHDSLVELKNHLRYPFILSIDANAHHQRWGSDRDDGRGRLMVDWMDLNSVVCLNSGEPTYITHQGNFTHIDITLCSPDIASSLTWEPYFDSCNSDHFPLIISSNNISAGNLRPYRWQLHFANWSLFRDKLQLPHEFASPTQACGSVTSRILAAAESSIKKTNKTPKYISAHWWNSECSAAKKQKNLAFTRNKNHRGDIQLWIELKKQRAIFRKVTLDAQKEKWEEFLSKITNNTSSSEVWNQIKKLRNKPSKRSIVLKIDDKFITEPKEVANLFAIHYSKQSNGITNDAAFLNHKRDSEATTVQFSDNCVARYNDPLTLNELKHALSSCHSRSPGPDSIPYAFIHQFSNEQLSLLLDFYNFIFVNGYPHQWREGQVIPIAKPNKVATNIGSYRPIALTNCLAKLLGKMINKRLLHFLESIKFFHHTQSGFRASHSTLDAVVRLEFDARTALLNRNFCVAVFIDIAGAFDTVWHHGVLLKLRQLGLGGNLGKLIQQFIQCRKIHVRYSGALSPSYPLHCGVPQGSVLSPTLFSVLINDIFSEIPLMSKTHCLLTMAQSGLLPII